MSFRRRLLALLPLAIAACAAPDSGPTTSIFGGERDAATALAADLGLQWFDSGVDAVVDGIEDAVVSAVELDELGMAHVRLDQTVGGVPVFGGQVIVHLGPDGTVESVTDGAKHGVAVDASPGLSSQAAIAVARAASGESGDAVADLQVLRLDGTDHLCWRVRIDAQASDPPAMPVVFVDAHGGAAIWQYDNLQTALNRRSYDGRNRTTLPGTLRRTEGQGPVGDAAIDDAHDHAGITWSYYMTHEGRDSFDGAGGALISTAHHKRDYDNAFWNGTQMVYGDGAVYFYPLSGALDVVGHELTHAVTERSANLIYSGESGGLNEATSDILGVAIEAYAQGWTLDGSTWLVGEDIARPALGAALRYMDNPTADGVSIDHYGNYTPSMDVHHSSGIANKAFYLMATSGTLDLQAAAHLWYRALTVYMTPSTTFSEARAATTQAAVDLFGAGAPAVATVEAAWTSVGVAEPLTYTVIDTRTGLSASAGSAQNFTFTPSAGAQGIRFATSGGTGDADLYVRFGAAPTTTTYDCRPYATGNTEACQFQPAQVGTYYVSVLAYQSYSGLTLTVSEAGGTPPPPTEVCDDGLDNDLDGSADCADADCATEPVCLPDEVCGDGLDNDLDGSADCADDDCAGEPACAPTCAGGLFTGTLNSGNKDDEFPDTVAASGLFSADLVGPAGTNFDLYLEYWAGTRWRTRATSATSGSVEQIDYNEGSTVLHRWRVHRTAGNGAYELCIQ